MEWIETNPVALFTVIFYGVCFIADIWLKLSGRLSISEVIWYVCEQHPTLYSLGFAITIGMCWLTWNQKLLMAFNCYVSGHLFSGIASGVQGKIQFAAIMRQTGTGDE